MTAADYIQASMQYVWSLGPLLLVLSALGLADKILSFLFYLVKQTRGIYK